MLRFVVSIFFILHGLVHLLWFAMSWQFTSIDGLPFSTTLVAKRINVGDSGIRIVGLLWVVAAGLWLAAALGFLLVLSWWQGMVIAAALFSSAMCILGLPEAKYGLLINLVILLLTYLNGRFNWLQ